MPRRVDLRTAGHCEVGTEPLNGFQLGFYSDAALFCAAGKSSSCCRVFADLRCVPLPHSNRQCMWRELFTAMSVFFSQT